MLWPATVKLKGTLSVVSAFAVCAVAAPAVMTIAGRIVTLNLYGDYVDRTSFDGLLANAKETAHRTILANGPAVPPKSLPPGMVPVGEGKPSNK